MPKLKPRPAAQPAEVKDWQFNHLSHSYMGIILAGVTYPPIIFLLMTAGGLPSWLPNLSPEAVFAWLVAAIIICSIGASIGAFIAGFFGIVITILVGWFNQSLGHPFRPRVTAMLAGGFTGYLCTCLTLLPALNQDWWVLFLGPILATTLGSLMALWTAIKVDAMQIFQGRPEEKYRLQIKHLFILTAWVALLFTIIGLAQTEEAYVLTGVGFAMNGILVIGYLLVER